MPADIKALGKFFADWQEGMQNANAWDALFWDNHDQPRALSRFGNDCKFWDKSAKLLAGIIHLMRGTPYIYQGDEIGMTNSHFHDIERYRDVESKNYYEILQERGLSKEEAIAVIDERSRDNGRTPMQWNTDANAGFTTGTPWIEVVDNFDRINAASQTEDANSIFSFYKELISLRKSHKIISEGAVSFDKIMPEGVLSYNREYEGRKLKVWGNMTENEIKAECKDGVNCEDILIANYADAPYTRDDTIVLRPYEFVAVWSE